MDQKMVPQIGCPDCGCRQFHPGPAGGVARNIQCVDCKSTYNCSPMWFDRIIRDDRLYNTDTVQTVPEIFAPFLIDYTAQRWLIQKAEPNFSHEQRGEMLLWLAADPKHRQTFHRLERAWGERMETARKQSQEVDRIIRMTDERGEFVHLEDGFLYYAPTGSPHGVIPAWMLRALADELDKRNAPHEAEINDYFERHPQPEGLQ